MLTNEVVNVDITSNNETGEIIIKENKIENVIINIDKNVENEYKYTMPEDYFKNPEIIKSMKLPELRKTLKFYKNSMVISNISIQHIKNTKAAIKKIHDFTLVGNKKIIQERLINYFEQERIIVKIQKIVRGHFVKRMMYFLGPAVKNRSLCVNDSDFITLDPLSELPLYDFFSYSDKKNMIYGFQMSSLITLIKMRGNKHTENPFNRENINHLKKSIKQSENLIKLVQTKHIPKKREIVQKRVKPPIRVRSNSTMDRVTRLHSMLLTEYNYDCDAMINFIRITRSTSLQERSRQLFMEIDNLGNYSDHEWFTVLDRRGYLRYFRILRDIWTYRALIPANIKFKICPLWDPFFILTDVNNINDLTIEQLQSLCLSVMEDMVYTGVESEFKTLGSMHVLSVLTIVNIGARQALPWLYESLTYNNN